MLETSTLIYMLIIASPSLRTTNCPWKRRGHCHVTSNFWKISDKISRTVRDSLIVSIKFELEVVCALSNGYVADDLGCLLSTLNHLNFYILHRFIHLRNWRSQRLQIWCKGWIWKSQPTDDKLSLIWAWSGHVTHYKIFRAPIISLERLNLKSSNFVQE